MSCKHIKSFETWGQAIFGTNIGGTILIFCSKKAKKNHTETFKCANFPARYARIIYLGSFRFEIGVWQNLACAGGVGRNQFLARQKGGGIDFLARQKGGASVFWQTILEIHHPGGTHNYCTVCSVFVRDMSLIHRFC